MRYFEGTSAGNGYRHLTPGDIDHAEDYLDKNVRRCVKVLIGNDIVWVQKQYYLSVLQPLGVRLAD